MTADENQKLSNEANPSAIPSAESKAAVTLDAVPRWSNYRMWYRKMNAVANSGSSAELLDTEWRPTDHVFRARNQPEAQKKANKFWRECQFGAGSMLCVPADEDLRLTLAATQETNTAQPVQPSPKR